MKNLPKDAPKRQHTADFSGYSKKPKKHKKPKKRKSAFSRLLDEAWDVVDDIFD